MRTILDDTDATLKQACSILAQLELNSVQDRSGTLIYFQSHDRGREI